MKKTIKIIDLLNMIAKDEEVPKKIKYQFKTFELNDSGVYLRTDKVKGNDYGIKSLLEYVLTSDLNEEIEIISDGEEFEDIEQIQLKDERIISNYDGENHYITTNVKDREVYIKLINQLIKNQKKIIEKLNKNNNTQ